jgi:hypothetical protein
MVSPGTPDSFSTSAAAREPFDPAVVGREMQVIRDDLRCDAVRITGGDRSRLETAARHAAEAGLEVWYSPFTNGLTPDELLSFLTDSAARAERLRYAGAQVTFLTGSEISLFTDGFLPGSTPAERLADPQRLRAALPGLPAKINEFLGKAAAAVRTEFRGKIGYASLPLEGVDWAPFDIVATDAAYPDARTAGRLADGLRALRPTARRRRRRPRLRQSLLRHRQGTRQRTHRNRLPRPALGTQGRLPRARGLRPNPGRGHRQPPGRSGVKPGGRHQG